MGLSSKLSDSLASRLSKSSAPSMPALAGVFVIMDPADAVVIGGKVETFNGGISISQANADRRAMFNASDADFNGQPSAMFASSIDGTTSFNQYVIPNADTISEAAEVFAVLKSTYGAGAAADSLVGLWTFGSNNCCYPYVDGHIYDCFFASARPQYPDSIGLDLTEPHIYNVRTSAAGMTATHNGSVIYSSPGTVFTPIVGDGVMGSTAVNQHFNGKLAYLVICGQVQTPEARAEMLAYLSERFGIVV